MGWKDKLPPVTPATPPPMPIEPLRQVPRMQAAAAPISITALPQRPGILSAIGIVSILVACLSLVANLAGWGQSALAYRVAASVKTMRSSPAMAAASTQPGGGNPLTPGEISKAIQHAQTAAGNRLTSAHVAGLTMALQDPNQQLVSPGTAWSPVRAAMVNPDGSALVYFSGGIIMLDAQGQMTSTSIQSKELEKLAIPVWVCLVAEGDAVANLLLAVLLFVAAIMLIRNGRLGRRLHMAYALVKIPLSIGGGLASAATICYFWSVVTSQFEAADPAATQRLFVKCALVICGTGLIYPILLAITMNSRRVRQFYRMVGG